MREVGGDLITQSPKTTPFPHIPEAPTPASLEAVTFSSTNRAPQSASRSPSASLAQTLLCPEHDKLIVLLLLKAAFPSRGSPELTGFCGRIPQGRAHKDTTVWDTGPGSVEQDPRLILQPSHQRGSHSSQQPSTHTQHIAQPWTWNGSLAHVSLGGEEGGGGRTLAAHPSREAPSYGVASFPTHAAL